MLALGKPDVKKKLSLKKLSAILFFCSKSSETSKKLILGEGWSKLEGEGACGGIVITRHSNNLFPG